MTLSPHGLLYESVGVFCPNDRLELLRLLREEDILIDWSKPLYINFVHYNIAEELTCLYEGTGTIERVVGDVFACDNPQDVDILLDPNEVGDPDVEVLPLKAEHAEGIHELYPANDMECHEVFLRLIRSLPAAGVFAKGRLAAWMVQSYYGAMFSMQTKPEYRRKGYGTKLARYLTKKVAERGYQPFVVIRPENEASQSLYKKLGFRKLYQTVRMTFMPSTWEEMENDTCHILRDNMENAFRQLTIEQKVVDAFTNEEEFIINEETVDEVAENEVEDVGVVEEPNDEQTEENKDLQEEEAEQEPEERIEVTELSVDDIAEEDEEADDAAEEVNDEGPSGNAEETSNDDGSNQNDGGTEGGDSE
ncbi:uncharacterized protein LOC143177565 isoform X2 [Calliopsis andreniformis]